MSWLGARLEPLLNIWSMPGNEYILFWDVLRQRGNQYQEHLAKEAPHVLDYDAELVIDGPNS